VGQMNQLNIDLFLKPFAYEVDLDKARMYASQYKIGSILNSPSSNQFLQAPDSMEWIKMITDLQDVFTTEGSMIPILYGLDSVHGANYVKGAALFPQQINAAASFNRELTTLMGAVTAKDTRIHGIPWTFSPILDLAAMPIWSRVFETFGEDPYLISELGVAIIQGYQGQTNNISDPTKVAACMKHFLGYGNPRTGQDQNPSWIPDRFLYNYFIPSFQAAVDAGAATVMESYNDINGEAVCGSKRYLQTLLREEMGFEGLLVTDWEEIKQLHRFHKIAATDKDAVKIAIGETSIDLSMVPTDTSFYEYLLELVQEGVIPESRLDESVTRILQLKEDLGILDNPYPDPNNPLLETVGSTEDRNGAYEMGKESVILAVNKNSILPLRPANYRRILLAGPSSDSLTYMSGGWTINWQGAPLDSLFQYGVTVREGVEAVLEGTGVEFVWRRGCDIQGRSDPNEFEDAVYEASISDVVILCIGEDVYAEVVGNLQDITLQEGQLNLLAAMAVTGTPVIVVIFEGRSRVLTDVIDEAAAVLVAFLPGPEGGRAVADLLFGNANPSGRMPISYPKSTGIISPYWHKVTERYNVQWEFGHGLSYSNFEYSNLRLSNTTITPKDQLTVSVMVRNNGPYDGKETVLLYITDEYRQIVPEVKMLKRFEKVFLAVGNEVSVTFVLTIEDLSFYGIDNKKIYESGDFTLTIANLSARFLLTE